MREDDGLPTKICYRCLYSTELFSEFRDGVHECERKLKEFILSLAAQPVEIADAPLQNAESQQTHSDSIHQNDIVIIDPTKCYESSADEDDDDNEQDTTDDNNTHSHNTSGEQMNYELLASMYNRLSLPSIEPNRSNEQHAINLTSGSVDPTDAFQNVFFCKYCECCFAHREHCEAHETNNHDPATPYVCNFCSYRSNTRFQVITHIKQAHQLDKPYVCVQCNKNFGRRADLKKHAVSHTGTRPFQCPICNKTFSRKTNVTKHIKIHDPKTKTYSCQYCSRSFNTNNDLLRHERTHSKESLNSSQLKQEAFIQQPHMHIQGNLNQHAQSNYWSESPYSEAKMQQTLLDAYGGSVNFIQQTQNTITQPYQTTPKIEQPHQATPKNEPKYSIKCTMSSDADGTHIPKLKLTKHIQKSFPCEKCEKTFGSMSSLKNHKRIHSNTQLKRTTQPMCCSVCSKKFKTKREFDRHSLTHTTSDAKFQCSVCKKQFLRRDKLVRHEKIHTNRKNTIALPESAFLPENLKRSSQLHLMDQKSTSVTQYKQQQQLLPQQQQQEFKPEIFRPQFYAEYDLSQTNL